MEYIPALAIIAGIGAGWVGSKMKDLRLKVLFLLLTFFFLLFPLVKTHPNENVYFNSLIGGLSGAKEKDFPFWGNTFGAGYRQAVTWLNKNAEPGAKVAYAFELIPNIPRIWLRTDLNLTNKNRSGYLRSGEYVITLPYRGTDKRSYFDMYLHKFLNPVYETKVDGVSVVTIWKNDEEHLKERVQESIIQNVKLTKGADYLLFDVGGEKEISRLEIDYREAGCEPLGVGFVEISKDGAGWERLPGVLPNEWRISSLGVQPVGGHFIEPFVGQAARFIKINLSPSNTCLKNVTAFKLFHFTK